MGNCNLGVNKFCQKLVFAATFKLIFNLIASGSLVFSLFLQPLNCEILKVKRAPFPDGASPHTFHFMEYLPMKTNGFFSSKILSGLDSQTLAGKRACAHLHVREESWTPVSAGEKESKFYYTFDRKLKIRNRP